MGWETLVLSSENIMKPSIFSQNRKKLQELLWLMLFKKLSDNELACYFKTDRKIIHWYRVRHGLYKPKKRLSPSNQSVQNAIKNIKEVHDNPVDERGEKLTKPKDYKTLLAESEARSKKP